jgi:DUF971 family protein
MQHAPQPIEVRRLADQRQVLIAWSDGHASTYPYAHLRGWCPCALCQGHSGEKRFVHGNSDLEKIEPVGRYALTFTWGDGHETGIYSYTYLRQLCPCADCAGRKA